MIARKDSTGSSTRLPSSQCRQKEDSMQNILFAIIDMTNPVWIIIQTEMIHIALRNSFYERYEPGSISVLHLCREAYMRLGNVLYRTNRKQSFRAVKIGKAI